MSDTPTAALVEEAQSMTTDTLIEEAMGEMHRLGIDNLRAKGAIVLLVEALRRAEAELDAATTQLAKKFKRLEEALHFFRRRAPGCTFLGPAAHFCF